MYLKQWCPVVSEENGKGAPVFQFSGFFPPKI